MTWKRTVLVVANVTAASDELLEALASRAEKGPAEFVLVVPATGGTQTDRRSAERSLAAALGRMRDAGLEASGAVGDSDPAMAVREAWDPARFDEIVVSTLPTGASRWLQVDLPHRVERITDAPVTHVVAAPPRSEIRAGPAPPRRASMGLLSPLQALGRGGGASDPPPDRVR